MFIFYTFACFIKILKDICNKKNNEDFIKDFFEDILKDIALDDVKRKKKKIGNKRDFNDVFNIELYFDKSKVSKLLNNKINILKGIKNKIFDKNNKDKINFNMNRFINDNMESISIDKLIEKLKTTILEAENLSETEKETIKNLKTEKKEEKINFICEAFKIALHKDNKLKEPSNYLIWSRGKNSVNAIIGDLFTYGFNKKRREEKNIVVIPVDTSFETKIKTSKNDFPVSETTIHGQFLSRMYKITVPTSETEINYKRLYTEEDINNLIENNLKERGIQSSESNSKNKPLYPIGTIAVIYHLNTIFYLLAISEFDENNNAQSNEENIKIAIENLLEFYDKKGQGYPLYLPLIGTWLSRVNLSPEESFEIILSTIMKDKNKDKIHGEINIVIWEKSNKKELEGLYKFISEWKKKNLKV